MKNDFDFCSTFQTQFVIRNRASHILKPPILLFVKTVRFSTLKSLFFSLLLYLRFEGQSYEPRIGSEFLSARFAAHSPKTDKTYESLDWLFYLAGLAPVHHSIHCFIRDIAQYF